MLMMTATMATSARWYPTHELELDVNQNRVIWKQNVDHNNKTERVISRRWFSAFWYILSNKIFHWRYFLQNCCFRYRYRCKVSSLLHKKILELKIQKIIIVVLQKSVELQNLFVTLIRSPSLSAWSNTRRNQCWKTLNIYPLFVELKSYKDNLQYWATTKVN